MDPVLILLIVLGIGFAGYLLYSGQFRWVFGVVRNMFLGIGAIFGINFILPSMAVGVNAVTAIIVGLLGLPGFLLLYAARLLAG